MVLFHVNVAAADAVVGIYVISSCYVYIGCFLSSVVLSHVDSAAAAGAAIDATVSSVSASAVSVVSDLLWF